MRIHTDIENLYTVLRDVAGHGTELPGVGFDYTEHGSRSHARAFELSLTGTSPYPPGTANYNPGDKAATWDEWGVVLAAIFAADPAARAGGSAARPIYGSAEHFHHTTAGRFTDGLPEDTHPRHKWVPVIARGSGGTVRQLSMYCDKCSAEVIR